MAKRNPVVEKDIRHAAFEALYERHDGRIGPRILLEEARSPASPFHDDFEWDDEKASELYRLAQAAQLIRRWMGVVISVDRQSRTVKITTERAVQSPQSKRGKGEDSYRSISDIMRDPELREDMLRTVLRELLAYRRRYAKLNELAGVWGALDELIDAHAPLGERRGDKSEPRAPS